jgi:predicted esterase
MRRQAAFALVCVLALGGLAAGCGESTSLEGADKRATAAPGATAGPPALHAAEPAVPQPSSWPFDDAIPRTSGFSRLKGGAAYWSGFLYDDHGALGTMVAAPPILFSPPVGTYVYPAGAPAHQNGADIAAAAVGLRDGFVWLRVDWQTLVDANFPAAMWAFDTDDDAATGNAAWPLDALVSSDGVEAWLFMSGGGAWLVDASGARTPIASSGGDDWIDTTSRSFVAKVPASMLGIGNRARIRLGSGMARTGGSGFARVPVERGSLPGQPSLYDVAFRTHEQEPLGRDAWWRDRQLALSLALGDVTDFSLVVDWHELARKVDSGDPRPSGWLSRWYFSSIELGPGIAPNGRFYASDFLPNFMGRRQPYGIYVPARLPAGTPAPLSVLLHSINLSHNQFINWNPAFIRKLCEERGSICIAPLGRGADGWWANEAELDVWEVWNRVATDYPLDPSRTVLAGYSMGGYGAYRLGLEHPDLFAAVLVLAGAPACSVRIVEGIEGSAVSGNRECDKESNTSPLIENARETPFYLGHDALDELAPVSSALEQADRFDALGQQYRIEIYSNQDHVVWSNTGTFEGAVSWLTRELRHVIRNPPRIAYGWYAQHQRDDLGIGPGSVWWLGGLRASSDEPGFRGRVDVWSHAIGPGDPVVQRLAEPVANSDGAGTARELRWPSRPATTLFEPAIDADLSGVSALSIDLPRAGFSPGQPGTIRLMTDALISLQLSGLKPGTVVQTSDGRSLRVPGSGQIDVTIPAGSSSLRFGN